MKEIISVRSNAQYIQKADTKEFELQPMLEVIIIHTNGKNYNYTGNTLKSTTKFEEVRFSVSPEILTVLITDLQFHQKKLDAVRKNADQINALAKHIEVKQEEA